MRARRRQGWWVCAFGVAVTAPVAYGLVDPGRSVLEVSLAAAYGGVIGLVLGFLLIRADLRLHRPAGPAAEGDRGGHRRPARARAHPRPLVRPTGGSGIH